MKQLTEPQGFEAGSRVVSSRLLHSRDKVTEQSGCDALVARSTKENIK